MIGPETGRLAWISLHPLQGDSWEANRITKCILGDGAARAHYLRYAQWLAAQPAERLAQKRAEADALFHRVGITFAVYGQEEGAERLIPFDIVPRVLPAEEWIRLEAGLKQRVRALNAFIHDIYHDQQILKAGVIPAEQVLCNSQYRPEMQGRRCARRHLRPHRRHRHRARRRRRIPRARGQPARALRRLLHAREPQDDDAPVPGALLRAPRRAGRSLPGRAARQSAQRRAHRRRRSHRRAADRRAPTTAPTSSTPSSPSRWASSWSRARICSCATKRSSCAPPRARSASM